MSLEMTVRLQPEHERALGELLASGKFASMQEAVANALEQFLDANSKVKQEPIWERLRKLSDSAPEGAFDSLPDDGASQLDHYVYGLPKRDL
jgi:Arc/MetJ-type ribon-helix-helix transcriptional regulator